MSVRSPRRSLEPFVFRNPFVGRFPLFSVVFPPSTVTAPFLGVPGVTIPSPGPSVREKKRKKRGKKKDREEYADD